MFESVRDPGGWQPIPAAVLAEIGSWEIPDVPGQDPPDPAGLDELIHQSQLAPVDDHTLGLLNATPHELLSEQGLSLKLSQLCAVASYVDALRAELTALIAGPRPASVQDRQDDFTAQAIAVATRCSVYAADRQIWLARDLTDRLTATAEAMRRGEISLAQARALSDATSHLELDVTRRIETKLLRHAYRQDLNLFNASLRRWVARLDPDFTSRARDARTQVEVSHTGFGDGVGQLYIRGPLEITTTIHLALTGYATKTKESLGGTVDQRKLAGLRDWAEHDLAAPDSPRRHGRTPTVNVVIDLPTLLGLRDHPAEIPGIGPLPADAARWLLTDGAPLRRLITDPTNGQLLDYGTTTYTVPADLADHLIAKNVCSAAPHSTVDARLTDMEHNTPHHHGGPTNPINCTPVDRRWHRAKTHGGWTYTKNTDNGVITWTSPTGLSCRIEPHDYRAGP